ncbi:UDP-N-acetylglucosamine 2-epimerase (non-hydrolyzing) [Pseudomonas sp.]|uniref:non-hydrolyzing UDP-N-acetylglucosamine 2-epimerase n=1 Tax=Pseudomonas sp. TaxID=306 RepID=UPI0031D90BD2
MKTLSKKIICIVGTRPEAIKMAPVILALRERPWAEVKVLVTAQHRGMLDQILREFSIVPDFDLNVMQPNQSLSALTGRLLIDLEKVLKAEMPDVVLAQGDTTTVLAAAMTCFYAGIAFGHVEAGLRTGNMHNPFPEEFNRVVVGRLAKWHFTPTPLSAQNLLAEGTPEPQIHITGNTVIDALQYIAAKDSLPPEEHERKVILVTAHRRENFGEAFRNICTAIRTLAIRNPNIDVIFPVHPNPNVKATAHELLSGIQNISLIEPLGYREFIHTMNRCHLILSDSGGVQEEAPALGKPVLVLRNSTERPEAVEAGCVRLVGSNTENIVRETELLLNDSLAYREMAKGTSPYGDGNAASRIIGILQEHFS